MVEIEPSGPIASLAASTSKLFDATILCAVLDALTALSYVSIAVAITVFAAHLKPALFRWISWCFALSMLACGLEHIVALFHAHTDRARDFGLFVKCIATGASCVTATGLWPLLPRVMDLPTDGQLRRANSDLDERMRERDRARDELARAIAGRAEARELFRQVQKVEAVGHVAGGLAHDFNNLLSVIVGNLDRASRQLPSDSKAFKLVIDAMTATDRAVALVAKLMAFARREPIAIATVSIDDVLHGIEPMIVSLAPRCRVVVERACAWHARIDANELETIVLNLTVNARDAMAGGGTLTIRTEAVRAVADGNLVVARDHILIEVMDSGTGMSPDIKAKALDPFFTTKPKGAGTGLGLSQVASFMQQAGGSIRIDSDVGKGTVIRLYIPRVVEDVAIASRSAAPAVRAIERGPSAEPATVSPDLYDGGAICHDDRTGGLSAMGIVLSTGATGRPM